MKRREKERDSRSKLTDVSKFDILNEERGMGHAGREADRQNNAFCDT